MSRVVIFGAMMWVCVTSAGLAAQDLPGGVGIGLQMNDDDQWVIAPVLPGGPAARAGIVAGDQLLAIDGRAMDDIDDPEIPQMIRGEAGAAVTLTVRQRDGATRDIRIVRAIINLQNNPQNAPPQQHRQPPAEDAPPHRDAEAAADDAPPPAGVMKFTRVGIRDPGINNIEAISFLIPAGWKTEGGVQWFHDYSVLANLLMKITDPQSGAQIQYLPIQNFTFLSNPVMPMQNGTNYMGNIVWPPTADVNELVQTFYVGQITPHLKGATLVGQQELPKIEQIVAASWGPESKVKASRVRYEYQVGGRPWEEDVYMTIVFTPNNMGVFWSVTSSYAFRAPKGELDKLTPVMSTIVNTARMNPDWFAGYMYVQQLFNNRMNQGIKNAAAISETITRNSEEIRKMYSDAYRARSESQDRISQGYSEYIRGVETYKNPYEDRPVQLPSGYNDAWVNNKGEYLLSNQAGFDPNVGDTSEWRRMDRRN